VRLSGFSCAKALTPPHQQPKDLVAGFGVGLILRPEGTAMWLFYCGVMTHHESKENLNSKGEVDSDTTCANQEA
jgi:hypothetical protein